MHSLPPETKGRRRLSSAPLSSRGTKGEMRCEIAGRRSVLLHFTPIQCRERTLAFLTQKNGLYFTIRDYSTRGVSRLISRKRTRQVCLSSSRHACVTVLTIPPPRPSGLSKLTNLTRDAYREIFRRFAIGV